MKSEQSTRFLSVKEYNRLMMRRAIYLSGPLTRTSLAQQLGLSLPTITTSVALMLEEGLLMEEPYDYKGRPYGRPARQIDFLPQARLEIGIELGKKMMRGCMCDLRGGILKSWGNETIPEAYDELLARLVEKVKEFSAQIPAEQLIGIGIALSDYYTGSQTDKNGREWNTAMLKEDISARVRLPTACECVPLGVPYLEEAHR